MIKDNNTEAFLLLVRAGLWERGALLAPLGEINYEIVYRLAQEQSVVGLIAAGLEHITDVKVPKEVMLMFAGAAIQLEQRNLAMNAFIEQLIERLSGINVYTLLVKGQGIAQCYERPLWRTSGDIDLFFNDRNYERAKDFLAPQASSVEYEDPYHKHLEMAIDSWIVELHGHLRFGLSARTDRVIDEIQDKVFSEGRVRIWMNGNTQVLLPDSNSDILFVFTHFIRHFYKGGVGIRQICDWCRLIWAYRDSIEVDFLKSYLEKMGLVTEWKAFSVFAVEYLGMPKDAMPLYNSDANLEKKASKICSFVIDVGNMGHNRDSGYLKTKPYLERKCLTYRKMMGDFIRHITIFPYNSFRFFFKMTFDGMNAMAKGK